MLTSTEIFKLLLDRGADPTQISPNSESAITRALTSGNVNAVKMLIDRNIELKMPPMSKDRRGQQKKLIEEAYLGSEEMANLVLDRGALRIDPASIQGQEGLSHAVHCKWPGMVKRLLEQGVDPRVPLLRHHPSLLAVAIYPTTNGNIEDAAIIIDLLLAHGADIEERGCCATTPLHWALTHRNQNNELDCRPAEIELLLERGADTLAEHGDYWVPDRIQRDGDQCPGDIQYNSLFMDRRSTPIINSYWHDRDYIQDRSNHGRPSRIVPSYGYEESDFTSNPFVVCVQRGDKSVLKLMIEAIEQRRIPFRELKDRLERAQIQATENGHRHILPILQDHYWGKRHPCQ